MKWLPSWAVGASFVALLVPSDLLVACHAQEEARTLADQPGPVVSLALSPDGKTFASGTGDGMIRVWNVEAATEVTSWRAHQGGLVKVAFADKGDLVLSGGFTLEKGEIRAEVKSFGLERGIVTPRTAAECYDRIALSYEFSKDGSRACVGTQDGMIRIWDMKASAPQTMVDAHAGSVHSLSFASDGVLVSGGGDGKAKLWDAKTWGAATKVLPAHEDIVSAICITPDGKLLATGGYDETVLIWSFPEGKPLDTLLVKAGPVTSLAFSSDGKKLAVGSDGAITLWAGEGWKKVATLKAHRRAVNCLCFNREGTLVLSGGLDRTIKIWRPQ